MGEITVDEAKRLADALIVGMETKVLRYPALKSRINCLLVCLNKIHRRLCDTDSQNDKETSTCVDFSFAKVMKWGKTAVEEDEVWETSDTVLELFQRFLDALNVGSHHCLLFIS